MGELGSVENSILRVSDEDLQAMTNLETQDITNKDVIPRLPQPPKTIAEPDDKPTEQPPEPEGEAPPPPPAPVPLIGDIVQVKKDKSTVRVTGVRLVDGKVIIEGETIKNVRDALIQRAEELKDPTILTARMKQAEEFGGSVPTPLGNMPMPSKDVDDKG